MEFECLQLSVAPHDVSGSLGASVAPAVPYSPRVKEDFVNKISTRTTGLLAKRSGMLFVRSATLLVEKKLLTKPFRQFVVCPSSVGRLTWLQDSVADAVRACRSVNFIAGAVAPISAATLRDIHHYRSLGTARTRTTPVVDYGLIANKWVMTGGRSRDHGRGHEHERERYSPPRKRETAGNTDSGPTASAPWLYGACLKRKDMASILEGDLQRNTGAQQKGIEDTKTATTMRTTADEAVQSALRPLAYLRG